MMAFHFVKPFWPRMSNVKHFEHANFTRWRWLPIGLFSVLALGTNASYVPSLQFFNKTRKLQPRIARLQQYSQHFTHTLSFWTVPTAFVSLAARIPVVSAYRHFLRFSQLRYVTLSIIFCNTCPKPEALFSSSVFLAALLRRKFYVMIILDSMWFFRSVCCSCSAKLCQWIGRMCFLKCSTGTILSCAPFFCQCWPTWKGGSMQTNIQHHAACTFYFFWTTAI